MRVWIVEKEEYDFEIHDAEIVSVHAAEQTAIDAALAVVKAQVGREWVRVDDGTEGTIVWTSNPKCGMCMMISVCWYEVQP